MANASHKANSASATLMVLAAGALWGLISLFVRGLSAGGLSTMDISCVRMYTAAVGMGLVLLLTNRKGFKIRLRDLWMFVGTGVVSVTLFNIAYFTCMQMSEASIAVVLLYTSPVFVMLMSAVIFKERITKRKLFALVMTVAGCVLVAGVLGGGFTLTPVVACIGLASGLFYALYSIFSRIALRRYDTMTVTFYTFLMGAACALFITSPVELAGYVAADHALLAWMLGIGIFCTIVPYLLYTKGLSGMETGRAAILATVEPLVGSLLGIFAYHETAGPLKLMGMALIFAACVVLNLGSQEQDEQ